MKPETLRNAVDAHGWLGLLISIPLFIIFWTGAMTLFHPEVDHWAAMPQFPLPQNAPQVPLTPLINKHIETMHFDNSRRLFISPPSDHHPYLNVYIPVIERAASSHNSHTGTATKNAPLKPRYEALIIDPATGNTLANNSPFQLAGFLNEMHFTLKLPQGRYLVGIVCFFCMVILLTGLVIQFKKIIRHFFLYRTQGTQRHHTNDFHNVIGVISLPYGIMYALTGLMFNLGIVFEIPTLKVLYQGDTAAMTRDSGYTKSIPEPANIAYPMPSIDAIAQQIARDNNGSIHSIRLHNYNDENATFQFFGVRDDGFTEKINANYHVKEQTYDTQDENNNFSNNVDLLLSLHMADFAGLDLRFIYFVLAIAVCAMIVAGNLLWIIKRQKRAHYPKILALTRALTLGGCMGIIVATAAAFMLERLLPVTMADRADYVVLSFYLTLLACIIIGFLNTHPLKIIHHACLACASICLFIVLLDITTTQTDLIQLWRAGYPQPFGVSFSILITALTLIFCAKKIRDTAPEISQNTHHNSYAIYKKSITKSL
nr:PepSY-associated TM helix domain-containing protein [Marinagarivorans algicola]